MSRHVSILGLGWLGLPLALGLQKRGYSVNGSTSELGELKALAKHSFHTCRIKIDPNAIVGDWESFLNETSILIINFPPERINDIELVHPLQIKQIIKHTPKSTRVIFVSSTSVYQNTNSLINETINCMPEKASGNALIAAEQLLQQHFGNNLTILRLAGLIGPKRNPGRFLANRKQLKNPNVPVNLIHQKDVIGLIEAILKQECYGEIINGCADLHPKRKDFYENAAQKLNMPAPVFEEITQKKFKLVDNTKSKLLLSYTYQFSNPEWIFTKSHLPEIAIIESGPDDEYSLTLTAFDTIKNADIILYDNLLFDRILALNIEAEHVYVGGLNKSKEACQKKMDTLIKTHYEQGNKVVCLKSENPNICKKTTKEVQFLKKHRRPYSVVPRVRVSKATSVTRIDKMSIEGKR